MINFKQLEKVARALEPKNRGDLRCFHVAFIFKGSKLLQIAHNKNVSHPKIKEHKYHERAMCHAEIMCCLRAGKEDYSRHTMAVLRLNMNGELAQSQPCKHCAALLKQLNFRKIFYTNSEGQWEQL